MPTTTELFSTPASTSSINNNQDEEITIDEDRPRSITIENRQEEEREEEGEREELTTTIIQLVKQDSIKETTSSLASFEMAERPQEEGKEGGGRGGGGGLTTAIFSTFVNNDDSTPSIIDPIEGHDSEFDVELSPSEKTLFDTIISSDMTISDDFHEPTLDHHHPRVVIEEHAQQDSDCCPLTSSDINSSTHHLGKSNFYEKVVKSIQKSIRRIFHSPQSSSKATHMGEEEEGAEEGSLCMITTSDNNLSEIPSMAINPLISPITSVMPDHVTNNHTNPLSLHKTLLIDVAYSKPLLVEQIPIDMGKKCLVLDLDETLVHSTFQPVLNADLVVPVHLGDGVFQPIYVCKRPGVDTFLKTVSENFEVIIFTASLSNYADPVIDFLDPAHGIRYRLYREDCLQFQGMYIKDLSRLGRDIDQTLIIDNSPASYSMQPHSALGCRSWFKDPHDRELEDRILPLLLRLKDSPSVSRWRNENLLVIDTPYHYCADL